MNEFDPDNEASDRRIDAGLAETLGGERAPDVTHRVLAALREESQAAKPSRRSWLVAAAVLVLGAFAVIATWQARREEQAQATTPIAPNGDAPLPQEPGWIEIDDARAIPNLPEQATAVQLRNLGDASVEALFARLPKLQFLSVFCSTVLRRNDDPADPESITDAAFATIAKFASLRMLRIEGCDAITGAKLGELAALPLLESVSFRFCDTSDAGLAVLPRLPSLRSVALHGNLGFGEAGLRAIADCPGLVRLELSACGLLPYEWFAPLERLRHLQELDLAGLTHHRGIGVGLTPQRHQALTERVLEKINAPRVRQLGFRKTTEFADGIRSWPSLRVLDLSEDLVRTAENADALTQYLDRRKAGSEGTDEERQSHAVAKRLLVACPSLETLKVAHCNDVDDEFVRLVLQLPNLRSIDLSQCKSLTDACVPMLCEAKGLRTVQLEGIKWFTVDVLDELLAAGKDVPTRIPHDRAPVKVDVDGPATEAEVRLRHRGRYEAIRQQRKLEALPPTTTHLQLVDLGDQAAMFLRKRGNVLGLEIIRETNGDKARPRDDLTDIGLSLVTEIATIEALRLQGDHELTAAGFAKIANLRDLQCLELVGLSRLTDADVIPLVRALPKLRTLSLNGCYRVTPAVLDAIRAAPALQRLDATALAWMTPEVVRDLQRARPGLSVTR